MTSSKKEQNSLFNKQSSQSETNNLQAEQNVSAQEDGFRYDYDDDSDLRK